MSRPMTLSAAQVQEALILLKPLRELYEQHKEMCEETGVPLHPDNIIAAQLSEGHLERLAAYSKAIQEHAGESPLVTL